MLDPSLDAVEAIGLLDDIGTLTLDRGYDYPAVRARLDDRGLTDLDIQRRGTKPKPGTPHRLTLGLRWIVEATNTWRSNYGQLRRSTDRRNHHRHAALRLATPPCSSSADSSTTETDGADPCSGLSAQLLTREATRAPPSSRFHRSAGRSRLREQALAPSPVALARPIDGSGSRCAGCVIGGSSLTVARVRPGQAIIRGQI
jgi:hypothetical protein